jgi:CNT family concentrative nucleoside transporter
VYYRTVRIAISRRRNINWITVFWGLVLQLVFALLILKTYPQHIFAAARALFEGITAFWSAGAKFLFGSLAEQRDLVIPSMASVVIFVSSMMTVVTFLRVLPAIIYGLAKLMRWTMRTSGAETLGRLHKSG